MAIRKTIKSDVNCEFVVVANSDDQDDTLYTVDFTIKRGTNKKTAYKLVSHVVKTYTKMSTFDFCRKQGFDFFLEWKRGNYVYL